MEPVSDPVVRKNPKHQFVDLTVKEPLPVQCLGSQLQQINMQYFKQQNFRVQVREKRGSWTPGQPDI